MCDGKYKGERYFRCQPAYGQYVPLDDLEVRPRRRTWQRLARHLSPSPVALSPPPLRAHGVFLPPSSSGAPTDTAPPGCCVVQVLPYDPLYDAAPKVTDQAVDEHPGGGGGGGGGGQGPRAAAGGSPAKGVARRPQVDGGWCHCHWSEHAFEAGEGFSKVTVRCADRQVNNGNFNLETDLGYVVGLPKVKAALGPPPPPSRQPPVQCAPV